MKNVLLTGVTGAIGKAIAAGILDSGNSLVFTARDRTKAERTIKDLSTYSGNVSYRIIDLSDGSEIYKFAEEWKGPLHVIINNAACTPRKQEYAADGTEMMWAVNVLAYFRIISAFKKHLCRPPAGGSARIVNVASYYAGGLNLSDPEFKKRHYNNDSAYRASKQADRMLSGWFGRKFDPSDCTVTACHPGDVNSRLSNNLGFGGHQSPAQGAATPLYCALSPEAEGITASYFANRSRQYCEYIEDTVNTKKLIDTIMSYE